MHNNEVFCSTEDLVEGTVLFDFSKMTETLRKHAVNKMPEGEGEGEGNTSLKLL